MQPESPEDYLADEVPASQSLLGTLFSVPAPISGMLMER